jgi:hypothetical protein
MERETLHHAHRRSSGSQFSLELCPQFVWIFAFRELALERDGHATLDG